MKKSSFPVYYTCQLSTFSCDTWFYRSISSYSIKSHIYINLYSSLPLPLSVDFHAVPGYPVLKPSTPRRNVDILA